MDKKKLLVIEADGMAEIVGKCQTEGWSPVFIKTEKYSKWLPENGQFDSFFVKEYKSLSYFDIVREATALNVQAVLPISLLEPEAVRDSLVKDYFQINNVPINIVANSSSTMEATFDKALTKEILAFNNLPITAGQRINSMEDFEQAITEINLPIIVKESKSFTGMGVRIYNDIEQARKHVAKNISKGIYIEPFIEGSEVSVEVIAYEGTHVFQPLVYKGETRLNILEHPAYRPRISPYRQNTVLEARIIEIVRKAVDVLKLNGAAEFEFIVVGDNPYIMEVNPRISGVSRLCNAAGGINVFDVLTHIAINGELATYQYKRQQKFAIQFPLCIVPEGDILDALKRKYNIHYVKPINWMPLLPIKSNIIVSFDSIESLLAGIADMGQYSDAKYIKEATEAVQYF